MIVWKHHISIHFLEDPSLISNNGVGKGGMVFTDFDKMREWLKENDKREFMVVPINVDPEDLDFCYQDDLRADSKKRIISKYNFDTIDNWKKIKNEIF